MVVLAKLVKELRDKTGAGMLDCKKALEAVEGDIEKAIVWLREKGISKATKKSDRIAAEGIVNIKIKDNKAIIYEVNSETDFVAKNTQFIDLINLIGDVLLLNNVKNVEEALKIKINNKTLSDIITNAIATIGEKITLRRFFVLTKNSGQTIGSYVHANSRIAALLLFDGNLSDNDAKSICMHVAAMNPKFISRNDISSEYISSEKQILLTEAKNDPKNSSKPEQIISKMVEGRLNKQLAEICLLDQIFVVNPDVTVGNVLTEHSAKLVNMIRYEVGEGIEKANVDFACEVMSQVKK